MRRLPWERLPVTYRSLAGISEAGWAWEFLRRSPDYPQPIRRADDDSQPSAGAVTGEPWGLRSLAARECSARDQPIFWRRSVLTDSVQLVPALFSGDGHLCYDPAHWPGSLHVHRGSRSLCIIVRHGEVEHRLFLPGPDAPAVGTSLYIVLQPDGYAAERWIVAQRFLSLVAARPSRPRDVADDRGPSTDTICRRMFLLWSLDLQAAGTQLIDMAHLMFGAHGLTGDHWKSSDLRSEVRRIRDSAVVQMQGGYRDLLMPPRRRLPIIVPERRGGRSSAA